jgi:hypothetical protein
VDEETAAVLKNSRFAQDFLFIPIEETLPTPGNCSALESKVCSTSNFKLEPFVKAQTTKKQLIMLCSWLLQLISRIFVSINDLNLFYNFTLQL